MGSVAEEGIVEQVEEQNVGERLVEDVPIPPTLQGVLSINPISEVFVKYIGIPERRRMRVTCHVTRELLLRHPLKMKKFEITMVGNGEPLSLDREGSIFFKSDLEERSLEGNRRSDEDLKSFMRRDLKSMIVNKDTEIEELFISHRNTTCCFSHKAMSFITVLRLNVVKFHITADEDTEIRDGLTILNPRCIQEIWIHTAENRTPHIWAQNAGHFAQCKVQWRWAKVMIGEMVFQTEGFVSNFGHFDYAHLVVENTRIALGVLEKLKDTLLLRPTVQKFEIVPSLNHNARDPLFIIPPKSFKPFQDPTNPDKFIFPYPDSQEVLTFEISFDGVMFKGPAYSGDKDVRKEVPRERIMEELVENEAMYDEEPYYFNQFA